MNRLRIALFVVGLGALCLVLRDIGLAVAARAILDAGVFVPILMLLEAAWMGMDILVIRAILGDAAKKAPWSAYARSAVTAYSVNIFFPAGRAAAEVTRATMLSPHLGAAPVALAAAQLQGSNLLGIASISIVALVSAASALGAGHRLVLVIAGNALATGTLGAALLFGARAPKLWASLRRRFPRLPDLSSAAADPSSRPGRAILLSFTARAVQCALYTAAMFAAARVLSPVKGSMAQGIALAGSTIGDAVPQQVGVAEGAFLYFAGALGLAGAPEKAVSIALLIRVCQVTLGAMALAIGVAWKERSR